MKQKIMFLLLGSILAGCIAPMPKPPVAKSDKGRECVLQCQERYNQCLRAAQGTWGAATTNIIKQCNQMLDDCYTLCGD